MIQTIGLLAGLCLGVVVTLLGLGPVILAPPGSAAGFAALPTLVALYILLIASAYVAVRVVRFAPALLYAVAFVYSVVPAVALVVWVFGSRARLVTTAALLSAYLGLFLIFLLLFIIHLVVVAVGYAVTSAAAALLPPGYETFSRSALVGLNAWMNLFFSLLAYPPLLAAALLAAGSPVNPLAAWEAAGFVVGVLLSLALFVTTLLAAYIPASPTFKWVLGWTSWLQPMSWLVVGAGWLLFYLNLLGHALFSVIPGFPLAADFSVLRLGMRDESGAIVTHGGVCSNLNLIDTAYNMGTFVFVDFVMPSDPALIGPTEEHEVGHHYNLAAFGGHFHMVGFADEMRMGALGAAGAGPGGQFAYAEQLAESNVSAPTGAPVTPMW